MSEFDCPKCGDERWDMIPFEYPDYFECVNSGTGNNTVVGKYHWWEGWKTCPKCGYKEWIHEENC